MAYAWIAFYEEHQFVREVPRGRPPLELTGTGGRPLRITSLQLYDHDGWAVIEQLFHDYQPVVAVLAVPGPEYAGTSPCHVVGWQETAYDAAGLPVSIRHLAHVVEDGRVIMTPGPVREEVFLRPRRRLHRDVRPFTWAAVYDDILAPPSLYQFDPETGVEVSGERIDRARLRSLILTDHNGDPRVEQLFEPGQRVIYRRRVEHTTSSFDSVAVSLLGWRRDVFASDGSPAVAQHVSYTFERTGRTIMAGPFITGHPVFHEVVEVPADLHVVGRDGIRRTAGVGR